MDLKLKTKLDMFRNTEHENFYNGSSKGMGTISNNTADEMYKLINELELALIKAETSQGEALNLADVSQQRKLLLAYETWISKNWYSHRVLSKEEVIVKFLSQ